MRLYLVLLRQTSLKIVGTPRFISVSTRFDDFNKIVIGDRLVTSMNVHFLTHDYSYTTALHAVDQSPATDKAIIREIKIGDNVFIGMNSIILPGTTIGDNVIVGAGSVVRGKVPSGVIIAGNPAQEIGRISEHVKKIAVREKNEVRIDKR